MNSCTEIVWLLGAYADGELAEDERALVASHLGTCASCPDRLRLLAAQGAAVRERVVARAAGRDLRGLADRVMAAVAAERPAPLRRVPVWTSEMWEAHRGAFATAGSLALAACLALAMIFKPDSGSDSAVAQAELAAADATAAQVDEVDFESHDGAVMQLRDRNRTPVIWLGAEKPQ